MLFHGQLIAQFGGASGLRDVGLLESALDRPRNAFVVTRVFLGLNDVAFDPPEAEAVVMVEGLASGEVAPADFAAWVRRHTRQA